MDIKQAASKHRKALEALPNVVSVGIGPELRDGEPTGVQAIKVFVSQKLPAEDLAEDTLIPQTLEGFPTDVEVIAPLSAR